MTHKEEKQLIETGPKIIQMLFLVKNDLFKGAIIINVVKKLKDNGVIVNR